MSPPEHALVLCCDEKSQVQALDRTQPGLPLKKGRAATLTHDYKRHGTTTLFAALSTLDGSVISRCAQRHRHTEWLEFLRQINRETPKDKDLHLICDNYATHKHPNVQAWLDKHPRCHVHFTPTSASWLNMVERFSEASPPIACSVACSRASGNSPPPSSNTSPCITRIPNPSSGLPRPMTSCRKSFAPIASSVRRKTKHYTDLRGLEIEQISSVPNLSLPVRRRYLDRLFFVM
jgi:hypothetical protein